MPKKGFRILLAACRRLDQEGFDFHLTLAGDGPERRKLRQLIDQYGLQAKVTLPGFVPHREVPRLLQSRRSLPHAQPHHPFRRPGRHPQRGPGGPGQEVPVVATAVSGLPEVIRPPETGWLAPPADPEALARAVREACADQAEARRRASAGRELVAREFDSVRNYSRLKVVI